MSLFNIFRFTEKSDIGHLSVVRLFLKRNYGVGNGINAFLEIDFTFGR